MKNIASNIKRALFAVALLAVSAGAGAQALRTGYFMDGNLYGYRLNPALQAPRGHFSLPIIGGMQMSAMGNVGIGNFLYDSPTNPNELVTFMHQSVDTKEFLNKLEDENKMRLDLDYSILSVAFRAFGGFNTIDLNVRSQTAANLPYGMFAFMKEMGNKNYSFSDLTLQSRNFVDLSIGHSREVIKGLTAGARFKILAGLAYAGVKVDRMDIKMGKNSWEISAKANADIALGGAFTYDTPTEPNEKAKIDGYEDVAPGNQGYGFGADFGVTYDFNHLPKLKGLKVSASVTDLGYITWNKTAQAGIDPGYTYKFDGFTQMSIHNDKGNTLDDQWETTREELKDFFTLEDKGEGSVTTGIGAKVNLGLEYEMPFYNKLSAGLLYTHCFDDALSYNQTSLIVNISPNKVFDFAVSGTMSTFGTSFGAMANVHCTGFNIFFGADLMNGKVNNQFAPIEDFTATMSMGISIAFGHVDKKKAKKEKVAEEE